MDIEHTLDQPSEQILADKDVVFTDRRYGKSYVRLLHVRREGKIHSIKEIQVSTRLTINNNKDFLYGDNSSVVATDSQKNTVFILAKQYGIKTIEDFGLLLCNHFLMKYPQMNAAYIHIQEAPWRRIIQGGKRHVHAFVHSPELTRTCEVSQQRGASPSVTAGIEGLKLMKTTQSSFENFVNDEFRILPDAKDRVFCTVVQATWKYHKTGMAYDKAWATVKECILEAFAGPADTGVPSPSVQTTLYNAQKLALSRVPEMESIEIILPNVHAYEFDFSKFPAFGISKNNEVFMPSDAPSGNIRATLCKRGLQSNL